MKFLCSNCKAKYQIADEKVAGRTLRMTCRRCKQEIVIHGEPEGVASSSYPAPSATGARVPPPPPPPPASALGADFQLQVGGHAHARVPIAPPVDQWHVGINDVPVGPMRRDEIAHKLAAGAIGPDSLAWREGLDDWLPIRQIAELAVLFAPPAPIGLSGPAPLHLPPPRVLIQPAQRTDLVPIGGRAGAAPAYGLEDWAPVAEQQLSHSQVGMNPLLEAAAERRNPVLPSWPVMFALAGGFAFLMSALAITGARWLVSSQRPATPAAAAPSAEPTRPAPRELTGADQTGQQSDMVIGDLEAQNQARAAARGRPADPNHALQGKQPPKKELSAEQKAMLARMGGGEGTVADLRPQSGTVAGSAKQSAGSLTADHLNKVMALHGREQLQRCYMTAARGAGSTDTVRVDVSITVSPAGNVTAARMGGEGLPGMSQCIERTVRMWRFPNAGDSTEFKFPIVFQPGA